MDRSPAAEAPHLPLGPSLTPDAGAELPTLLPLTAASLAPGHSMVGAGWSFEGHAQAAGALTVAGEVHGSLTVSARAGHDDGHVTIAPGGQVAGRIQARSITVRGRTEGELDAPGGRVTLHETAVVHGRLRYTHLQVNGAELNGQLERVRPDDIPAPAV